MQKFIILLFAALTFPAAARDADKNFQLRFFAGNNGFQMDENNADLAALGIHPVNDTPFAGLEGVQTLFWNVALGARGKYAYTKSKEIADPPAVVDNPYYAAVQQSQALAVIRVAIVKAPFMHLDVVGGAGISKTKFEIRSALGEWKYTKDNNFMTTAGVSVGFGWGGIFLYGEAGQEWNKITDPKVSGANAPDENEFDMSGAYYSVGILFRGVPSFIRKR